MVRSSADDIVVHPIIAASQLDFEFAAFCRRLTSSWGLPSLSGLNSGSFSRLHVASTCCTSKLLALQGEVEPLQHGLELNAIDVSLPTPELEFASNADCCIRVLVGGSQPTTGQDKLPAAWLPADNV